MATPQPQKTMSSRLMNMKFMQRTSAPTSPAQPNTADQPSAKRTKRSNGSARTPTMEEASQALMDDEIAKEEARRRAALDRLAEAAGDTHWSLPQAAPAAAGLHIVSAGYGAIDTAAHGGEALGFVDDGRKSYGRFNKQLERNTNGEPLSDTDDSNSNSSDSDSASSESDTPNLPSQSSSSQKSSAADTLRAKQKAKRRDEARKARELAAKRKSKGVNLNKRGKPVDEDDAILARQRSKGGGLSGAGAGPARKGGRRERR